MTKFDDNFNKIMWAITGIVFTAYIAFILLQATFITVAVVE